MTRMSLREWRLNTGLTFWEDLELSFENQGKSQPGRKGRQSLWRTRVLWCPPSLSSSEKGCRLWSTIMGWGWRGRQRWRMDIKICNGDMINLTEMDTGDGKSCNWACSATAGRWPQAESHQHAPGELLLTWSPVYWTRCPWLSFSVESTLLALWV